jgi:hypothetical protein
MRKCHSLPYMCSLLSLWQSYLSWFVKSSGFSTFLCPSKGLLTSHQQWCLGSARPFDKADTLIDWCTGGLAFGRFQYCDTLRLCLVAFFKRTCDCVLSPLLVDMLVDSIAIVQVLMSSLSSFLM